MLRDKTGSYWIRVKSWLSDMRHEYIMLLILNITLSLVFLLYFARNGGDGIKYCNDMLAPSVIVFSVFVWKYAVSSWSRLHRSVLVFTICCAAFCSLILGFFYYKVFTVNNIRNYAELWETIQQYDNGSPMYLGMISSNYLNEGHDHEKDHIYFDDGHIEYQAKASPNNMLSRILLVDNIYTAGRKYIQTINQMAEDQKFSLIVRDFCCLINQDTLNKNYREIKSIEINDLALGATTFHAKIYVPIQ